MVPVSDILIDCLDVIHLKLMIDGPISEFSLSIFLIKFVNYSKTQTHIHILFKVIFFTLNLVLGHSHFIQVRDNPNKSKHLRKRD